MREREKKKNIIECCNRNLKGRKNEREKDGKTTRVKKNLFEGGRGGGKKREKAIINFNEKDVLCAKRVQMIFQTFFFFSVLKDSNFQQHKFKTF